MRISFPRHARAGLAVALLCAPLVQAGGELAHGERGIVATVHPLATDAAVETFRNGGNAIDGAVAAALALGIVDGHNSGIGGGCFILIRLADGRFVAIDGRETAPTGATRDMFVRDGKADPELSLTGPLAAGVPGALAAFITICLGSLCNSMPRALATARPSSMSALNSSPVGGKNEAAP